MHAGVTLILFFLTTAIALLYEDLGECLELTGGISASALAFIFPAAAFLKLYAGNQKYWLSRLAARLLLVFGSFVLVMVTGRSVHRVLYQ